MAQLMAMLRHKDPNKHLYLSEQGDSEIGVDDVDADGMANGEGKDNAAGD